MARRTHRPGGNACREVLIAHDFLVGEFVDGFLHPFEIALELFFRRFPPLVE